MKNTLLSRFFRLVADPDGPYPVNEDQTMITFHGSGSLVKWGPITEIPDIVGDGSPPGSGVSPNHTYEQMARLNIP